jgi:hypothetical protein
LISRHLRRIFESGELRRKAGVAEDETTAADGKSYQVEHYNLDVILSVESAPRRTFTWSRHARSAWGPARAAA